MSLGSCFPGHCSEPLLWSFKFGPTAPVPPLSIGPLLSKWLDSCSHIDLGRYDPTPTRSVYLTIGSPDSPVVVVPWRGHYVLKTVEFEEEVLYKVDMTPPPLRGLSRSRMGGGDCVCQRDPYVGLFVSKSV